MLLELLLSSLLFRYFKVQSHLLMLLFAFDSFALFSYFSLSDTFLEDNHLVIYEVFLGYFCLLSRQWQSIADRMGEEVPQGSTAGFEARILQLHGQYLKPREPPGCPKFSLHKCSCQRLCLHFMSTNLCTFEQDAPQNAVKPPCSGFCTSLYEWLCVCVSIMCVDRVVWT